MMARSLRAVTHAERSTAFDYDTAFGRTIGWITPIERSRLRRKRIAIAGLGGVGGAHLLTLTRLGVEDFHVADPDRFELSNFNRQAGANLHTIGQRKTSALERMARAINPNIAVTSLTAGVSDANIDAFLDGVDVYVDGLDFFVPRIRARVFAACYERGIPAITAAPIGMGTSYLVFMPGAMSFEQYFRFHGCSEDEMLVRFMVGLCPSGLHRRYLVDPTRLDLAARVGPSTPMAIDLCAGVAATEALKILLGRGAVRAAPYCHQFDAYRGRFVSRRYPGGMRHPELAIKRWLLARIVSKNARAQAR